MGLKFILGFLGEIVAGMIVIIILLVLFYLVAQIWR